MNPVVHFEMPFSNEKRMTDFYAKAFGWQAQGMGEGENRYVLATTTEMGPDNRPKQPGAINGGFYPLKKDWPAQHPSIVIAVDDLKDAMKKVSEAGGQLLGEPMDTGGYGTYISFIDTEGNRVSMIEPPKGM